MKVPNLGKLINAVHQYKEKSGKEVLLLVDTTFSPNSKIVQKIQKIDPNMPIIVFISLSKSVSGGFTTCGTLLANHNKMARDLLSEIRKTARDLDTTAKDEQLRVLVNHHKGVEDRLQNAYQISAIAAQTLVQAVFKYTSQHLTVEMVTPEQASDGFPSTTFSFNLPAIKSATIQENEALAQLFVDILCAHKKHFKPCVSFGQDNTLVYATVPATSTQGAIKPEDKEKQAVGGVQLVRLSFPPKCDVDAVCTALTETIATIYK